MLKLFYRDVTIWNSMDKVMNMEPNRPLVAQKELISPDAGTKKNWDIFEDMLKQTDELIKSGKFDKSK